MFSRDITGARSDPGFAYGCTSPQASRALLLPNECTGSSFGTGNVSVEENHDNSDNGTSTIDAEPSSTTQPVTTRQRGRPRIKPLVYGPKRKCGRPPKVSLHGHDQNDKRPAKKARRNRSPCQPITVEFGKFRVPGTQQPEPSEMATSASEPTAEALASSEAHSATPPPIPPSLHQWTAPPCRHQTIIENEDPNRIVDIADEADEADGAGIGAGDELYEMEDDAGDDDVEDAGCFSSKAGESMASTKRRLLPSWLMEPFRAAINESKQRDSQGLPPLYQSSNFWFPSCATYFILRSQPNVPPQNLYNPKFFLWDPQALYKVPCPGCNKPLNRSQAITHPRRVIDVDSSFWIIGYRYRCRHCLNPRTGRKSVTYRSWDPRIIQLLPAELAAEFPACLSHRSGISKRLFELMRGTFQSGLASGQFADLLRVQHLLAYDNLHVQYLNHLMNQQRNLDTWVHAQRLAEPFLPFDDISPHGRHGFTPSSEWLRDMYDTYIEMHQNEFNQHMSMLTGEICAIDHSHKVTKHVARVDGEQVFTALLTVTNEKGEIRVCNFVATKSHSQFEDALARMNTSLKLYGHKQPQLFYTDNMADKNMLETAFPSLRHKVTPLEQYAHLDLLQFPNDFKIWTHDTVHSINNAISTILNDVPEEGGDIVVGFDAEWNVELSPQGFIKSTGKTAILQIAYKNRAHILQISDMLSRNELPHQLELFLSHPRIQKAGRLVSGDLSRLQKACYKPTGFFCGALDIAKVAKERYVVKNTTSIGLSDLTAIVLGRRLNKNTPLRTCQSWENQTLTDEQTSYAAMDAYASLMVYNELVNHYPVPSLLLPTSLPLMPVLLYSSNLQTVVAEGILSPHSHLHSFDGFKISPNQALVDIQQVIVPGALISSHGERSLESFGEPTFSLICFRNQLRSYTPIPLRNQLHEPNVTANQLVPSTIDAPHLMPSSVEDVEAAEEPVYEMMSMDESLRADVSGPTQELSSPNSHSEGFDFADQKLGPNELLGAVKNPMEWDHHIHSLVLKDVWHFFHMIYIPVTHGLRKQFTRELRDAIFIPDKEDRKRINAWGEKQKPRLTYEQLRNSSPEWTRKRCRHTIPPPHILYPLVRKVFCTYGPLRDPITKQCLFSNNTQWQVARNILELVRKGFVSDPPGISLYTQIGFDKQTGLPMYRCLRGTNATEGGVHTHIRSRLPKFGVSIRHVQACLLDFTLRHNLLVGTYNSTGQRYRGHFSIWITNRIQELLISLRDRFSTPLQLDGWINGNLYIQTSEVIGILPIPDDIRNASEIAAYHSPSDHKNKHAFVARMQNTRYAVLPIHTPAERDLFRTLMETEREFSPKSGDPHWNNAVIIWNRKVGQLDGVYYKLVEHLKTYYTKWKALLHVKEALSLTSEMRQPLTQLIHDPSRSLMAPPAPTRLPQPLEIKSGQINSEPGSYSSSTKSFTTVQDRRFFPDTAFLQSPHVALETPTMDVSVQQQSEVHLQVRSQLNVRQEKTYMVGSKRRQRTCRKCTVLDCKGRRSVSDCPNPCKDCGRVQCKGRNSHKLHLSCKDGWD